MRRYQYPDTVTLELSEFEAEHLECLLYNRANDVIEPPHDVTKRLYEVDRILYNDVHKVLEENKAQRHIRGGIATKEKYTKIKKNL